MAEVNWGLLAQYPNAGQSFQQSFDKGMQQNALSAFAMNPSDPKAAGAAARYDPGAVLQMRLAQQKQQTELTQQQHEHWVKYAGELAKWADTPEKWDQAITYLASSNHPDISTPDLMALKGHFDPALRAHFMAQGGVADDHPPGDINEFNDAVKGGLLPAGTTFQQFLQLKNPGMSTPVHMDYGSTVQQGGGAPVTATGPDGHKIQYDPQTHSWQPMGGQAATPPATFPR